MIFYRFNFVQEKVKNNKKYIDILIFDKLNKNNYVKVPGKNYDFFDIDKIHYKFMENKDLTDEEIYKLYQKFNLERLIDFEVIGNE